MSTQGELAKSQGLGGLIYVAKKCVDQQLKNSAISILKSLRKDKVVSVSSNKEHFKTLVSLVTKEDAETKIQACWALTSVLSAPCESSLAEAAGVSELIELARESGESSGTNAIQAASTLLGSLSLSERQLGYHANADKVIKQSFPLLISWASSEDASSNQELGRAVGEALYMMALVDTNDNFVATSKSLAALASGWLSTGIYNDITAKLVLAIALASGNKTVSSTASSSSSSSSGGPPPNIKGGGTTTTTSPTAASAAAIAQVGKIWAATDIINPLKNLVQLRNEDDLHNDEDEEIDQLAIITSTSAALAVSILTSFIESEDSVSGMALDDIFVKMGKQDVSDDNSKMQLHLAAAIGVNNLPAKIFDNNVALAEDIKTMLQSIIDVSPSQQAVTLAGSLLPSIQDVIAAISAATIAAIEAASNDKKSHKKSSKDKDKDKKKDKHKKK